MAKEKTKLSKEEANDFKTFFGAMAKIFNITKGDEATNVSMTGADGETVVDFPEVEEGETPEVGAEATIDGQPAEGEVPMPNGETFVFVGGKLDKINPENEEEEEDEIPEDIQALIDSLTQERDTALSEKETAEGERDEAKDALNKAQTKFKNFQTTLKSKFDFSDGKKSKNEKKDKVEEPTTSKSSSMKERLKKNRNEKND